MERLTTPDRFSVNPTKVQHFLQTHYKQRKYSFPESVILPLLNLLS